MRIDIKHIRTQNNNDIDKYVTKKLDKLVKYIPKIARESVHAEVFLKEEKIKEKKECTAEIVLYLPHEKISTKETTFNIFAAVDIVEAKLKNNIIKYKETHALRPRLMILARHFHKSR